MKVVVESGVLTVRAVGGAEFVGYRSAPKRNSHEFRDGKSAGA
jgi:hypothetical protein